MFKTQQYCQIVNSPPNKVFNLNQNASKFWFKFLLKIDRPMEQNKIQIRPTDITTISHKGVKAIK